MIRRIVILIRGANQREILLIGDGKDDPPIRPLQEITFVVVKQARHHDMRPAHQPHMRPPGAADPAQYLFHPRPGGIHQNPRTHLLPCSPVLQVYQPNISVPLCRHHLGPQEQLCAALFCVAGIQHHQPGILYPDIGIFIAACDPIPQRRPRRVARQVQRPCRRQDMPPAQVIV